MSEAAATQSPDGWSVARPRDERSFASWTTGRDAVAALGLAYGPALFAVTLFVALVFVLAGLADGLAMCGIRPCAPIGAGLAIAASLVLLTGGIAGLLAYAAFAPVRPVDPADAIYLRRSDAPELFERIDTIADTMGIERYDSIQLSSQCNAAVERNTALFPMRRPARLMIGLPMLEALSEAELCSVIAHEFGHLRHDSRWIDVLARAAMAVDRSVMLLRGLRLHAGAERYAHLWGQRAEPIRLALARRAERDADAAAVGYSGADVAASALIRATIVMRAESEIHRRIRERLGSERPGIVRPDRLLRRWQQRFEGGRDRTRMLHAALIWRTRRIDSHPMLTDRLLRMGQTPRVPVRLGHAASRLLGARRASIREQVWLAWRQATAQQRSERTAEARWIAMRWRDLGRSDAASPLSALEAIERADLAWRMGDPALAIGPLRDAIAVAGRWPRLEHRLATCLSEIGDEEGFWRMLDLAEQGSSLAGEAAAWVADRCALDGDLEQAHAFVQRHEAACRSALRTGRASRRMPTKQAVAGPQLPGVGKQLLLDCIDMHWSITGAWLARVDSAARANEPAWLLVVDSRHGVAADEERLQRQRLSDQLYTLPFHVTLVDDATWRGRRLARQIRNLTGSALSA